MIDCFDVTFLKRLLSLLRQRGPDVVTSVSTKGEGELDLRPESIRGREKPWTQPVDKEKWRNCEACGRLIPVNEDRKLGAPSLHPGWRTLEPAGTCTYVCPFCGHGHLGTLEEWTGNVVEQVACYGCDAPLDGADQCSQCGYPRAWARATCPFCEKEQPVYMPHWASQCSFYNLDCVHCELRHDSPCIC